MCDTRSPKLFTGPGCTGAEFPDHDVVHLGHRYHLLPKDFVVRSVSIPPGVWSPQLEPFYARGELDLNTVDHLEFKRRESAIKNTITHEVSPAVWIALVAVVLLVVIVFLAL